MNTLLTSSVPWLVAALIAAAGCSKSNDAAPPAAPTPPASEPAAATPEPTAGSAMASAGSAAEPAAPAPPPAPAAPAIPPYTPSADVPDPIKAAIAAPDRSDDDRALDAGRKPGEVLAFFKIAPGEKVGELFSARGYTTELMARVVGDTGKVYAEDPPQLVERFGRDKVDALFTKPGMKNATLVVQPAETPFPPEAKKLDAVICVLNYHDFVWAGVDRAKVNKAVFAALKPGGIYGIVDHAATKGSDAKDVSQRLHRIDEDFVKKEILAAGFKLDAESDALANPSDPRDWSTAPGAAGDKRGTSDRFTLRFVKPGGKATKPAKRAS